MVSLFEEHLLTRRAIAVGVSVILAISSFPGIAIACEGAISEFKLGPKATEGGSLGAVEPHEEKELAIKNQTGEEVTVEAWSGFNQIEPFEVAFKPTTTNAPRCSVTVKVAAGALCYFRIENMANKAGGSVTIKLQASGAKRWFTELEAF